VPEVKLSSDQIQQLLAAGKDVQQLRELLKSAELAGLDVAALKSQLEKAEKMRNGLLTHFGGITP
jgi:hypothetical protein